MVLVCSKCAGTIILPVAESPDFNHWAIAGSDSVRLVSESVIHI